MPFPFSLPPSLPSSPSPLRLLVIDDQPALRAALVHLIATSFRGRVEVQGAESAATALRLLNLSPPRLALLDVDLAGGDGLELLPHFPRDCRVLVFTSQNDPDTRARALSLGAAFFLEKGAPVPVLLDRIRELLPTGMQGEHSPGDSGASSAASGNWAL